MVNNILAIVEKFYSVFFFLFLFSKFFGFLLRKLKNSVAFSHLDMNMIITLIF